jgi:hypothetical protein
LNPEQKVVEMFRITFGICLTNGYGREAVEGKPRCSCCLAFCSTNWQFIVALFLKVYKFIFYIGFTLNYPIIYQKIAGAGGIRITLCRRREETGISLKGA